MGGSGSALDWEKIRNHKKELLGKLPYFVCGLRIDNSIISVVNFRLLIIILRLYKKMSLPVGNAC